MALFMEPRTGKTLPALRWAQRREPPCLVVTPLSVTRNWQKELLDEGIEARILEGPSKQKLKSLVTGLAFGHQWFIVNPEGIRSAPNLVTDFGWNTMIVDEATCIRNPKAGLTKSFLKVASKIPNKAILTGLPNPEGPEDYVTQMIFAFGQFMGCKTYWQWRMRWMRPGPFCYEVPDKHRITIRDAVRENAFCLTAAKAGLFLPKVYQTRLVDFPRRLKKLYRDVETDWIGEGTETVYSVKKETWLAQLASGIVPADFTTAGEYFPQKVKELSNLIRTELGGSQLVIWSRFSREASEIEFGLRKAGVSIERIDGKTKGSDRERRRERFLQGKIQAIVCQPKIGSKGLDFSTASVAVFASNYWDLETRAQCLERTNHPLKDRKTPTLIIDLCGRDTVDETVCDALKQKWKSAKYFLRHIRTKARI